MSVSFHPQYLADDLLADRQRCGRRRAGRVEHMQGRRSLDQTEVLYQVALPRHRLCAHTRATRLNIGYTDAWHELLKRRAEAPFAERLPQLKRGHPRVFRDETPQAGISHRIPQVAHVDVCLAITLARK